MSGADTKPRLVLRVGVTGTRRIAPEKIPVLRRRVDEALSLIQKEIATLAANPRAKSAYALAGTEHVPFALRMVSPLAEGADRLAADAALGLGFDLIAPLPFSQGDYETDFPHTLDPFRDTLSKAHVIELDGGQGPMATLSYEAAGRFVVRNCDVLIAIWDGEAARGQGGTAEIVRFAARSDLPIWWIDPETAMPRLIFNASQSRRLESALVGDKAVAALVGHLSNLVLPPAIARPDRHGLVGQAAHHYCRIFDYDPHPLERFFDEMPDKSSYRIWRSFDALYRILAPPGKSFIPPATPTDEIQTYWFSRYQRADALSVQYGDRYRSSYVLIIFLALFAFVASTSGSLVAREPIKVGLEVATLLCVGTLVWKNHVQGWQERWIAYRLVAELCRKQIMLAHLGRTLPGADVNRVTLEPAGESDVSALPREAWVSWYYLATLRGAPAPQRSSIVAKQRAFDVGRNLIAEQKAYHRTRGQRASTADRRLTRYSDVFFVLTVLGLIVVLAFLLSIGHFAPSRGIELIAALFSGASAALVGLRAYAEFALLAQQSRRMEKIMHEIGAELDGLGLAAPLASQELGTILQRLAGLMMQDVGGWAQLFRLKAVETG